MTIEWTKIKHDVNGNPRYVCHFSHLLTEQEQWNSNSVSSKYVRALARAKLIGGKKFSNKQYGGGIVFQSYNLEETEAAIRDLLAKEM